MADVAIKADALTKRFGKFTAVDGISFEIAYGSIFGFLGANGSGKSTTIRMLCGILAPTSGTGTVGGFDINKQTELVKNVIGYVSQRFSLYADLNVEENLLFFGRIYGLDGDALSARINELMDLTGLGQFKTRLANQLSGGWKQKLAIANAIMHNPKIIFLDEPTAGIDPISRRAIWELLYKLADRGVCLFVSTHYMEEAERCNTIAFISHGKILRIGTPQELKDNLHGRLLQVECRPLMKASAAFESLPGVKGITVYGTTLNLNVDQPETVEQSIRATAEREGIQIKSIKPIYPSLEDVFAELDVGAPDA